jgi:hypothetical protein
MNVVDSSVWLEFLADTLTQDEHFSNIVGVRFIKKRTN